MSTAPQSHASRPRLWFGAFCLFALGLATRTLPYLDRVFTPQGLRLYGDPDVYYHLRRIQLIDAHWPRIPDFDAWMNFPSGAYAIWPPLFDFIPATLSFATGADPGALAAFWPPLLGALAGVALFFLGTRLFGFAGGLGSSALHAVLPGAVLLSVLGRVDHHIAEVLFQLLLCGALLRISERCAAGQASRLRDAAWLGAIMAAALWTWHGSPLFLVVPSAVACVAGLRSAANPADRELLWVIALAFAIAAASGVPLGIVNLLRGRSALSPNFPSLLQPTICAVFALGPLCVRYVLAGTTAFARGRVARAGVVVACAAALLLVPGVVPALTSGLAFLVRDQSPWLREVAEVEPPLSSARAFQTLTVSLGYSTFALPLVWLWHLHEARKRGIHTADVVLLTWVAHVTLLSFMQIRFAAYAAPAVALLPAWGLWLARGASVPRRIAAGAVCALALLPVLGYWAPLAMPDRALGYPQLRADVDRFLRDVERVTPSPGDVASAAVRPKYCVFAPWDMGHWILALAHRPVVANNFGTHASVSSYEEARHFFDEVDDEREAVAVLDAHGCRYAMTGAEPPELRAARTRAPRFARRLHDGSGSDMRPGGGAGRLRLVLETLGPPVSGSAAYALFERVQGARIRLTKTADDIAFVETTLRAPHRSFVYRRYLHREDGALVTRLAYPGRYRLGTRAAFIVSETAVREGRLVEIAPAPAATSRP